MATAPRALTNITIQFNDDDTESERTNALNRLSQAISAIAQAINGNASQVTPSTIDFANPTAEVGIIPVDGVLTTAMRSDAAPPIDQNIAPVWTNVHIFDTDNLKNGLYPQIVLRNAFAATAAVPQWSPLMQWIAEGWNGLTSQAVTFVAGARPTGSGGAQWVLSSEIAGEGFIDVFAIDQAGIITDATWEGAVVQQEYGGTGHTPPYAPGDILIGDKGGSGLLDVEPIQEAIAGTQIQWNQIVGAYVGMAEDGEDGTAGPPGARGDTGPQGPSGSGGSGGGGVFVYEADGEDGQIGPPGTTGARGPTGPAGTNGKSGIFVLIENDEVGEMGYPGPKGLTGNTGATGAQGVQGKQGPPGQDGYDAEDGRMIPPAPTVSYPAALAYAGM